MGKSYTHLSLEDRAVIQVQLEQGSTPCQIAISLQRSASTITRELKRNGWVSPQTPRGPGRPPVAGGYRCEAAQRRTRVNQCKPRVTRRLEPGGALWARVKAYLKAGHSPEQIAGILTRVHSDTPSPAGLSRNHLHRHLCHAAGRAAHAGDRLATARPCQASATGERARSTWPYPGHDQHP